MSRQDDSAAAVSSGVETLIERLRNEGVQAGRDEAEAILSEARAEARRILEDAKDKALKLRETAKKEASAYRNAGEEALKTAARDAVIALKTELSAQFAEDVQRLVSKNLIDEELLKRMILEVAGRASAGVDKGEALTVLLPSEIIGLDELRNDPDKLAGGPLTDLALGVTGDLLREGVRFGADESGEPGLRVRIEKDDIVIDLTDKAVANVLLRHLQPRFRAILEGIVK